MQSHTQNIAFELQETLFFESGQEIEEMISISLDPDIVIQPLGPYTQIRGMIVLTGQYQRDRSPRPSETEEVNGIQVERVVSLSEEVVSFSHRFPVEISIANHRIPQLDEVLIRVQAFDYQIASHNRLSIYATLHIYGISPEEDGSVMRIEDEESLEALFQDEEEVDSTELTLVTDQPEKKDPDPPELGQGQPVQEEQGGHETEQVHQTDSPGEKVSLQTDHRPLKLVQKEEEVKERSEQASLQVEAEMPISVNKEAASKGKEEAVQEAMHIELQESLEEEGTDIKDLAFLTELFADEEEDTYTQVTIYIAQADDSIETIAKRYEIPVIQLLKDNELSANTIEEGQLITIRRRNG